MCRRLVSARTEAFADQGHSNIGNFLRYNPSRCIALCSIFLQSTSSRGVELVALRDYAAIIICTASNGSEASMCSLATSAAKSSSLQGSLSGIDPVPM